MKFLKKVTVIISMLSILFFISYTSAVQAKHEETLTISKNDLGIAEIVSVELLNEQLAERGFTYSSTKDSLIIKSSKKTKQPFNDFPSYVRIKLKAKDYFGHLYDLQLGLVVKGSDNTYEIQRVTSVFGSNNLAISSATLLMNDFLAIQEVRYDGKKINIPSNGLKRVDLIYNNLELYIEVDIKNGTKIYEVDMVGLRDGKEVVETLSFYYDKNVIPVVNVVGERSTEEPGPESSTSKYKIMPDLTVMVTDTNQVVNEDLFYYFTVDKYAAVNGYGFMGGTTLADLQLFFKQDGSKDALWGINVGSDILVVSKKDLSLKAVGQINGKGQLNPEIKRYTPYVVNIPSNIKKWTKVNPSESFVIEKIEGRKLLIRPTTDYGVISPITKKTEATLAINNGGNYLGTYILREINGKVYLQGHY